MLKRIPPVIFLCFFLFSFRSYGQTRRDTLFYEIRPEMITQARVDSSNVKETKYYIYILLKEAYRIKFAPLTEDNIGNCLAVVYEGKIISPAVPTILAKIRSGRFQIGPYKKEANAKRILQQITNSNK